MAGPKYYDLDLGNSEQSKRLSVSLRKNIWPSSCTFHLQSFGEETAELNRLSTIGLLHLLKYAANKTGNSQKIVAVTSMGGKFGIEQSVNGGMSAPLFSPTQAAVVGLIKVAAKELSSCKCKAIDFTVDEKKVKEQLKNIASQVLSESLFDDSTIEAGYLSGERFGLSVIDAPVKRGSFFKLI